MGDNEGNASGAKEALPPPPPVPPNVDPIKAEEKKQVRAPMKRKDFGKKGNAIRLLTNHFKVKVSDTKLFFYHYYITFEYEDKTPADIRRDIGRKVVDQVFNFYDNEFESMGFAYDGMNSLFTIGRLPNKRDKFTVHLADIATGRGDAYKNSEASGSPNENDRKKVPRSYNERTFVVHIKFAAVIPMQAILDALDGRESANSMEAFRVFDIILRQHSYRQGCLLIRQSFFHNDHRTFSIKDGILGCHGYHSSFRPAQFGLSLNIDVSTTTIIQPGPVVKFLLANQSVHLLDHVDWKKARRTLKNLRIKVEPANKEFRITGLSDMICEEQMFTFKPKKKMKWGKAIAAAGPSDAAEKEGEVAAEQEEEVTVYDYFRKYRDMDLRDSAKYPCINVGKPKKPTYIPIELCSLLPLQRYTKALTTLQRSALVDNSRAKPQERKSTLLKAFQFSKYKEEPFLKSCGVSIIQDFTQVPGRVLPTPQLKAGNGVTFVPRDGRWNFNNKQLIEPVKVVRWAVVNFNSPCNVNRLINDLIRCGEAKGIFVEAPFDYVFNEKGHRIRDPPVVRVENMCAEIKSTLPKPPAFLLCLLPEKKNCDLYGPWKKKTLSEWGVVNQCIAPTKVNDQYLTNVLLKINAKLGGLNSMLSVEGTHMHPLTWLKATMILGMDVSHGPPGQSHVPSIAAVVSTRHGPSISRYRAAVRTQAPGKEIIENLFKPVGEDDEGLFKEAFMEFCKSSGRMPEQIIIFRDGVSESQFNQVLNIELNQIMKACEFNNPKWKPQFVVIVAQKKHHTRFFQFQSDYNVPPGTIIDNTVCHPHNNDFYLCAHAGMIGTSRPTHYHVLYDDIGLSADQLQELVHSLSYVYQRSTTAVSVVAPICYAHLAASQVGQFMKFEEPSETASSRASTAADAVPQLPRLAQNVANSMFFC